MLSSLFCTVGLPFPSRNREIVNKTATNILHYMYKFTGMMEVVYLTPASRSPFCTLWPCDFDLILIGGRGVMTDSPWAKFGSFSFSRFSFIMKTDTQTWMIAMLMRLLPVWVNTMSNMETTEWTPHIITALVQNVYYWTKCSKVYCKTLNFCVHLIFAKRVKSRN